MTRRVRRVFVIALLLPLCASFAAEPARGAGAGLTIIPTFADNIDDATKASINNALAFYRNTFSTNLTVNIKFYNMTTGLGTSTFFIFGVPYSSFRIALGNSATSSDDALVLASTPSGTMNPVDGGGYIGVKSANGRALGLDTPELTHSRGDCAGFTGSGCVGINVSLANSLGNLQAVVQHEVDELLGLGSVLGSSRMLYPWAEDLFRWSGPGIRSFSRNASSSIPCAAPPAYFSINGGITLLNTFNNCDNGGDYGDWITHSPPQVQDAFSSGGSPSLTLNSSEVRALDAIGYNIFNPATAPIVATGTASGIAITGATLNGTANPNGLAAMD